MFDRRNFLKAAGGTLFLPSLESFGQGAGLPGGKTAERFLCIVYDYGFYPEAFFPAEVGEAYEASPVLKPLDRMRDQYTVLGGFSHKSPLGGHPNQYKILSGDSQDSRESRTSVDQVVAEQLGKETRLRNLVVQVNPATSTSCSWIGGVPAYNENDPSALFQTLFGKIDKGKARGQIGDQKTILDISLAQARSLQKKVSRGDRQKLEEYFSSVRETEKDIEKKLKWLEKPELKVDYSMEGRDDLVMRNYDFENARLYIKTVFDLVYLAFKYDMTRTITVHIPTITSGHHGASHHSKRPYMIKNLINLDRLLTTELADLLQKFCETKTARGTMNDETVTFLTGALGDANSHQGHNLQGILAGGGFDHGSYRRIEDEDICNVFLTIMQRLGLEEDKFVTGSRALSI